MGFMIIFFRRMLSVVLKFIITIHLVYIHGYSIFRLIKQKELCSLVSFLGRKFLFLIIKLYNCKYMKCSYNLIISGM